MLPFGDSHGVVLVLSAALQHQARLSCTPGIYSVSLELAYFKYTKFCNIEFSRCTMSVSGRVLRNSVGDVTFLTLILGSVLGMPVHIQRLKK
jgi:hypothetical protein